MIDNGIGNEEERRREERGEGEKGGSPWGTGILGRAWEARTRGSESLKVLDQATSSRLLIAPTPTADSRIGIKTPKRLTKSPKAPTGRCYKANCHPVLP